MSQSCAQILEELGLLVIGDSFSITLFLAICLTESTRTTFHYREGIEIELGFVTSQKIALVVASVK